MKPSSSPSLLLSPPTLHPSFNLSENQRAKQNQYQFTLDVYKMELRIPFS